MSIQQFIMVKFFLPEAKQTAPKKKTDYRIIVYKQLLQLVKGKHLKYISNVVKAIKLANLQQKSSEAQLKQLNGLKLIKKRQLKLIVQYIMVHALKISNFGVLEKITNITTNSQQIVKEVQGSEAMKAFVEKVMSSNTYKQKLQRIGQLKDGISRKKKINKQKSKQRKAKKLLMRQHKELQTKRQANCESNQQELLVEEKGVIKETQEPKNRKKEETKATVQRQDKQKNNTRSFWSKVNEKGKRNEEQHSHDRPQQEQRKGRTQFIKKGRNKIQQEKRLKKDKFHKDKFNRQRKEPKQQPKPKQKQPHPSWLAKQQQKKQTSITQFEGKRILL